MISVLNHSAAVLMYALALGQTPTTNSDDAGPPGRADVVCMAVAIHIGQAGDQSTEQAASFMGIYYFGRAEAQLSEDALVEELRTVGPRIAGDRWEVEKTRCAQGLGQAGELLNRSADAISAQLAE